MTADTIIELPLDKIRAGNNDRKCFDPIKLAELAESIRESGLAQPITVRPVHEHHDMHYEIVAGERRYRAHQLIGAETIPAIVRCYDDETASRIMLIENLQRDDLNPMEEAWAYTDRLTKYGGTPEELARNVGVSPSHVKRRLDLLKLRPEIIHMVQTDQLGVSFAWRMARLDTNRQWIALEAYQADPRMGGERFTDLCATLYLEQQSDSMFDDDFTLTTEDWGPPSEKRPTRFTRSALLAVVRELLPLADHDSRPAMLARAALEAERLRDALT